MELLESSSAVKERSSAARQRWGGGGDGSGLGLAWAWGSGSPSPASSSSSCVSTSSSSLLLPSLLSFFFYNGECDAVGSVLPQGTENHQLYAKKWDNERDFFDSSRTWQFSNLVRSTDDVRLQDSTSRRAGSFSPTPRPEVQTFVCSCKNHASPCIVIHMHVWGWPEPDTCPFKKKNPIRCNTD